MSNYSRLVMILSLAACEHQSATATPPASPKTAPATVESATPAPPIAPVAESPPAPVEPAIAPVKVTPPAPAPKAPAPAATAPTKKLVKKCNPMSRAGCRWQEDTDERDTPRVTKRAVGKDEQ